jgi:hypothetical protein
MAEKPTISFDDIDHQAVPEDQESFVILLPVAAAGATETGRTAGVTTIQGDRTQKDRGLEFDYPKTIGQAQAL